MLSRSLSGLDGEEDKLHCCPGEHAEGLEALSQVQRLDWTQEPGCVAWMARCYIMTGR
jgi:hypothetical protein